MKTEILNKQETQGIDWNKPQWLVSVYQDKIVFTNGKHNGSKFEAICLPCEAFPKGKTSSDWVKDFFMPTPKDGLTIKITNE